MRQACLQSATQQRGSGGPFIPIFLQRTAPPPRSPRSAPTQERWKINPQFSRENQHLQEAPSGRRDQRMTDGGAEQVYVSPTALAQTSALLTEDRDEGTAQARQTSRKRLLNTTDLFEWVRKLTRTATFGIPRYTTRRAEVPPHRADVYSLRPCTPEVRNSSAPVFLSR